MTCACVCVCVCARVRPCARVPPIACHPGARAMLPGLRQPRSTPTVVRSTANCKTIKTASPSARDHRTRIMSGIVPGTVPVRTKLRPTPKMVLCFGRVFDPGSNRESSRHKKTLFKLFYHCQVSYSMAGFCYEEERCTHDQERRKV